MRSPAAGWKQTKVRARRRGKGARGEDLYKEINKSNFSCAISKEEINQGYIISGQLVSQSMMFGVLRTLKMREFSWNQI